MEKLRKKYRKDIILKYIRYEDNNAKKNTIKKEWHNIKENYFIFKSYIFLIKVMLIVNIFNVSKDNNVQNLILSKVSNITLKIKGTGFINILGSEFANIYYPNEVIINNIISNITTNKYDFNQVDNYVELIWNNNINNTINMFKGCSNIIEINLSNFDTSLVTNMSFMFGYIYSLIDLDISNFNTSNVLSMKAMFAHCISLISLNLSNFDTSKVIDMRSMFYDCPSLEILELSNFKTSNVKDMAGMFYNCSSLISLNLLNFDTSQVTDMHVMFDTCKSLKSLDLFNFDTSQVTDMSNMFHNCLSLTFLNLSNFDTSNVINIGAMFYNCRRITSIELSNFNTSQTNNIASMFSFCTSLKFLDLSSFDISLVTSLRETFFFCSSLNSLNLANFNTSLVTDMTSMFQSCKLLINLDISNFNTSNVISMLGMFSHCNSLISLNLSNFDTSKAQTIRSLFYDCPSLISLNLSNFNTSNVTDMAGMFYNCKLLTSLDLSNFETSQVTDMSGMFKCCISLKYINLKNFNGSKVTNINEMFYKVPENIVLCLNTSDKIFTKLTSKCYNIDCSNDWKLKQKIIIDDSNYECIEICDNSSEFKYIGKCYNNFTNEYLSDDIHTISTYKCEIDKNLLCSITPLNRNICSKCNNIDYYQIENIISGEYISCYNNPKGYYLDKNELLFKKCYHTCQTCDINGNSMFHNCTECDNNFPFIEINNNYMNCYSKCSNYYYLDNENNSFCTLELKCPKKYPLLIEHKKECIKNDIENLINIEEEYMKNELETITKTEEIKYYNKILTQAEEYFKSEYYNTSKLDNGQEEIMTTERMTITFTTIENEKNKINTNTTRIDIGECEALLRKDYEISDNEKLYLKKIDIVQVGMKTSKVGYDIYCNLYGTSLIKLNLTSCKNSKINIYIPIEINESLDKLNSSSGYYNDICYTTTSDNGTDITLNDRRKDFIDKNKAICQEDCQFSKYDEIKKTAECSCNVIESSSFIDDITFNKDKLLKNFKDIKNILNLNFLVCYQKLFNLDNIKNNIGFYIMFAIFLFKIISIFIFSICQFPLIKNKINEILFQKLECEDINAKEGNNQSKTRKKEKQNDIKISINKKNNKSKKKRNDIKSINEKGTKQIMKNYNNKNSKKSMEFIDDEINELSYDLAIQYDKRNFCQYYISLVKTKHSLIFSFFNGNDYNSRIIKIDLFFIGFATEYIINALFYNDETMHKIYKNNGVFDLEAQLPIIIYSTLISLLLNSPLNFLALSNDSIITFKQDKTKINIRKRASSLKNVLIIKFNLYFIISFVFLLFFWYYISMFCIIYINTKIHLLKDTLMSFLLSLLFPFFTYLLPGLLRIHSLSDIKNKRECLYKLSKFLQSF